MESRAELGGAGVNTGTVPSKTLRETAFALSGVRSRGLYGVDLSLRREATVADFLRYEQGVKAVLNESLSQRMDAWNTPVYRGSAAFADSHTVLVEGDKPVSLQAHYILVGTGSAPARPPGFPFGWREIRFDGSHGEERNSFSLGRPAPFLCSGGVGKPLEIAASRSCAA